MIDDMHRKTAPKVKRGKVQRKNRWTPAAGDYYAVEQRAIVIDRRPPGPGYKHLLRRQDISAFIELLPEWDELSVGLDAIVLSTQIDEMGWHAPGVVHISAWERSLWWYDADPDFVEEHTEIFDRLGVAREKHGGRIRVKWTEPQARAFQLLHILLHELGHHHDRMTTQSQLEPARGEPFAESYARRFADLIWNRYVDTFGLE